MAIKVNWNQKTDFAIGDTVKILYTIKDEGKKERVQPFEGTVIAIRGGGVSQTFTVRKIAVDKIGVERIFPLNSPWIQDLKVTKKSKGKINRAKLYFLRNKSKRGKKKVA